MSDLAKQILEVAKSLKDPSDFHAAAIGLAREALNVKPPPVEKKTRKYKEKVVVDGE